MMTLVIGGSGSGKSAFAEQKTQQLGLGMPMLYLATMKDSGSEECLARIARHQKMRMGKGFTTLPCPLHLSGVEVPQNCTVLLECMSNLVANELFCKGGAKQGTIKEVLKGVSRLLKQCSTLVVVSNEVFCDGVFYEEETQNYIQTLGEINRELARWADEVYEVVCGIPILQKGESSDETAMERV